MIPDVAERDWQQTRGENSEKSSSSESSQVSANSSQTSYCENEAVVDEAVVDEEENNIVIFASRAANLASKDGTNIIRPTPVRFQDAASTDNHTAGPIDTSHSNEGSPNGSFRDTPSRPKRVLSSNRLNILSGATTTSQTSTTKRIRFMSMDEILSTTNSGFVVESEEALDQRLGEELKEESGVATPGTPERISPACVPLLTPPQSPRQSIVEWPSNLVVDIALMAVAADIRPLSPASLMEDSQETEKGKEHDRMGEEETYTLTRRLSFIRVGSD